MSLFRQLRQVYHEIRNFGKEEALAAKRAVEENRRSLERLEETVKAHRKMEAEMEASASAALKELRTEMEASVAAFEKNFNPSELVGDVSIDKDLLSEIAMMDVAEKLGGEMGVATGTGSKLTPEAGDIELEKEVEELIRKSREEADRQ